ncbi:lysM domain-containing GPI-anchored protein 2 [Trifolium pratense]|uniref:lysM domain-containing GPI-anchored protein 2 n=1 Tax=Trifolium pratense TaxID=57577 RepID=UPI001E6968AC|nr:lysM domain-containing GPI-anchored protein 2 [Trifolium pratense]
MSKGNKMFPIWLITIAVVVASTQAQPEANFQCKTENATCRSITEYTNPNTTTLKEIATLFGIKHYLDFLGANNLPTNTQNSYKVSPNTVIKVPFPCKCNNGTGKSNHVPKYKIKPGDGLDAIARTRFAGLVKYQQIQTANKIVDANNITAGDTIWIPLPCSCDKVDGNSVMHYAHIVESGSSIDSIAQEYGTTQLSLLTINGIKDPKTLEAGQLLDVPLPVCNSSVKSDSIDFPLLVPNGTYFYTANQCVKCKCDSINNFMLQCEPSNQKPINNWSVCPSARCSASVLIGNTTSTDSCNRTVCDYSGYTSSNISTVLVTQNACAVTPSSGGGDSDSGASRSILNGWVWNKLLVLIHSLLFFVYLL